MPYREILWKNMKVGDFFKFLNQTPHLRRRYKITRIVNGYVGEFASPLIADIEQSTDCPFIPCMRAVVEVKIKGKLHRWICANTWDYRVRKYYRK